MSKIVFISEADIQDENQEFAWQLQIFLHLKPRIEAQQCLKNLLIIANE